MPDVQIRIPRFALVHTDTLDDLKDVARSVVAQELDCDKDNGKPLRMNTLQGVRDVDVHVMLYDSEDVLFHGGDKVLVQIQGYGYKDRMRNIAERLASIKEQIADSTVIPLDMIFVTFIRVEEGCWV